MRLSQFPFVSKKDLSEDLDSATQRLIKGCFISKESAGIFSFLPLGQIVLEKIRNIIKEEMSFISCFECSFPKMQDLDLWTKSGRLDAYGAETFKVTDRNNRTFMLAPTAEESCINAIKHIISISKNLPLSVYQIGTKYRDDLRPRFGLIRGKEFEMKDAYSFASNEEEAHLMYLNQHNAYIKIFKRIGLNPIPVKADSGEIGGDLSHEFVVLTEFGETDVFYDQITFEEISSLEEIKTAYFEEPSGKKLKKGKCIEVGHIFHIGDKYSKSLKIFYKDKNNEDKNIIMGCYGIGISRLLGVLAQEKVWNKEVAPFELHVISLIEDDLYGEFCEFDVIYDDRDKNAGEKFADADLLGIPYRVILGKTFEFQDLLLDQTYTFKNIESLIEFLYKTLYTSEDEE